MARRPDTHPRTQTVFLLLATEIEQWWYGYDIARQTGLASGTLYPILVRLAERGYLETRWETDPPTGRPPRHLYRLTGAGVAHAATLAPATRTVAPRTAPAARTVAPRTARPVWGEA